MWDAGLLPANSKLGGGQRGGGWFRYYIEGCSEEESAMFAQAIQEVFGGLEDARYIIGRSSKFFDETLLSRLLPEVLAKYVRKERTQLVMFHRVPACLAKDKKHAAWFEAHWNALVSPGQAVYAHSKDGKALLANAKALNLVSRTRSHLKDVFI